MDTIEESGHRYCITYIQLFDLHINFTNTVKEQFIRQIKLNFVTGFSELWDGGQNDERRSTFKIRFL
ncbi:hypothetical protein AI3045V2_0739 [Enterobacter cloacae]|nr:hypothetical protein L799_15460 [Enterobacter roggenkampii EC_38VIM1]KTJ97533.1 hypothetical protein ASU70_13065 [Enterobacter roggenkampii]CAE6282349.1 hypothetical protein AI2704V1_3595 [Enterobacter cloacae]KZP77600.1 hypothetical protein A3460_03820 [Enterobacter roggenkampii]CAE6343031.1 hypothetical protein AI2710V1_3709 [Enterobacter cloacae]